MDITYQSHWHISKNIKTTRFGLHVEAKGILFIADGNAVNLLSLKNRAFSRN